MNLPMDVGPASDDVMHWPPSKEKVAVDGGEDFLKLDNSNATRLLGSLGPNVNTKTESGLPPLHEAAAGGHGGAIRALTVLGSDVNAKDDNYGGTALHWAAWGGHGEAVKLLLSLGADVNAKDNNGWTPLHEAAWVDREGAIRVLISLGADINDSDNDGNTPLHLATKEGHVAAVKLLLSLGADVKAKDNDGWTAFQWVVRKVTRKGNNEEL